jgi:hypothetical protein
MGDEIPEWQTMWGAKVRIMRSLADAPYYSVFVSSCGAEEGVTKLRVALQYGLSEEKGEANVF